MNKRGFTLIELIWVIILLAVIALITYPLIGTIINSSRQKAYEKQIDELERLSYTWIAKNMEKLSKDASVEYKLTFEELNREGLTSSSIITNPLNNSAIPGCIIVTYEEANNKFVANYLESC